MSSRSRRLKTLKRFDALYRSGRTQSATTSTNKPSSTQPNDTADIPTGYGRSETGTAVPPNNGLGLQGTLDHQMDAYRFLSQHAPAVVPVMAAGQRERWAEAMNQMAGQWDLASMDRNRSGAVFNTIRGHVHQLPEGILQRTRADEERNYHMGVLAERRHIEAYLHLCRERPSERRPEPTWRYHRILVNQRDYIMDREYRVEELPRQTVIRPMNYDPRYDVTVEYQPPMTYRPGTEPIRHEIRYNPPTQRVGIPIARQTGRSRAMLRAWQAVFGPGNRAAENPPDSTT